jgi:hypothetical protein
VSKRYSIHPAIGIARLGSSDGLVPDINFFYGPEIPGVTPVPRDGSYRDAAGFLRRQAARFRVYEHDDAAGAAPNEVTVGGDVASIRWTVHLANKKAFWFKFDGLKGESGYEPGHLFRNGNGLPLDERRRRFIIDPGPRTVDAPNQVKEFRKGSSQGYPETWPGPLTNGQALRIETLGALLTDAQGRLTVVGGLGRSGTTAQVGRGPTHFANNPNWFDDTADGPITATVVLSNGAEIEAAPAWVIVGPPDFAPGIENIVSLYDLLYDLGARKFGLEPHLFANGDFAGDYRPSFTAEIYPILRRAIEFAGVSSSAARHRGFASPGAIAALAAKPFLAQPDLLPPLPSPADVFQRLRPPESWRSRHLDGLMPRLLGDEGEGTALTITRTQFHIMRQWSLGRFVADWNGPPMTADTVMPEGLDRAALAACVGGAFFPGIEAGWIMRRPSIYARPFNFRFKLRVDDEFDIDGLTPGSVTMRSALPWQADFLQCDAAWWPAQRPNQVRTAQRPADDEDWKDGITSEVEMVRFWDKLGIVRRADTGAFEETQRLLPRADISRGAEAGQ